MRHCIVRHRTVAVLLLLCALSANALGLDAVTDGGADVPESVLVARSVADLASVCSGRIGLSYAISGVTGRWQISFVSDGDRWPVRIRDDSPEAIAVAPVGDVLRALADADSSGAASLGEIGRLHQLLCFGYIQEHFRSPLGYDEEGLMVATGLDPASLGAMQAEYSQLVAKAASRGLIWPGEK